MASNLRVDTILPSSGTTLGIGTANGTINFLGNSNITTTGDVTIGGDLGVGGTITYEDVARVDATGLSTFREGFKVGPLTGIALTAYKDGSVRTSGVITATTYYGSGAQLTGITGTTINNNADDRVITGSGTANRLEGETNLTYSSSFLLKNTTATSTNNTELLRLENTHSDGKMSVLGFRTNGLGSPQTKIYGGNDNSGVGGQAGNSGCGKFKVTITNPSGTAQEVIYAENDASSKFLTLSTNGSERLRINGSGKVIINRSGADTGTAGGNYQCVIKTNGNDTWDALSLSGMRSGYAGIQCEPGADATYYPMYIRQHDSAYCGKISCYTNNTVSYDNASDYRLKQNDVAITDGISKVKLLRPIRFEMKSDPGNQLEGFFAHEVQAAVPLSCAANGIKDQVDSDNNPVYQGMDYGKLTPILTAALKEAIARIETLETEVAALKSSQ